MTMMQRGRFRAQDFIDELLRKGLIPQRTFEVVITAKAREPIIIEAHYNPDEEALVTAVERIISEDVA